MPRGFKKPPRPAARLALETPSYIDSLPLGHLVKDFGGVDVIATSLRIDPELVKRWISNEIEPPHVVRLCLFWLSSLGYKEAFDQAHWTHGFNVFLKNEARDRVELLEEWIKRAGMPLPPGRIMSTAEILLSGPDDWLDGEGVQYRHQLVAKVAALHATDALQLSGSRGKHEALPSPQESGSSPHSVF